MKDVKEFLKDYAEVLRSEMDWSLVAPCSYETVMAAGNVRVKDKNGEVFAVFVTANTTCSCPITHRDTQGAKLLVKVINYLARDK